MARINGLGGVFLHQVEDLEILMKWYKDMLGLDVTEYGINFLEQKAMTLITFHRKPDESIMLNFSVEDIETFMMELTDKGVQIKDPIKEYDYGKFAQIYDPFHRGIELCELNEAVYKAMVEKEIADFKDNKA